MSWGIRTTYLARIPGMLFDVHKWVVFVLIALHIVFAARPFATPASQWRQGLGYTPKRAECSSPSLVGRCRFLHCDADAIPLPAPAPKTGDPWTCTICSRTLTHGSKSFHLAGKPHAKKVRARAAEAKAEADAKARSEAMAKAKAAADAPGGSNKSSFVEVDSVGESTSDSAGKKRPADWTCIVCNRTMHDDDKVPHLLGGKHAAMAREKGKVRLVLVKQAGSTVTAMITAEQADMIIKEVVGY
ncbi:hypothetical protein BOTBODRAFT_29212 [Botryobasidium botryosum FD-172 SS1]|uniref:U1-type domain-containing protein n=1 Tax=Botryobasidium botryosum (strain FD-172 SS1) TaxID=930990 RepID=A0A067N2D2_BOTB1|nr:hypothetical protein BOTBODRAFT_29212 [Botryobasidium botryosum FD-172 SS1]